MVSGANRLLSALQLARKQVSKRGLTKGKFLWRHRKLCSPVLPAKIGWLVFEKEESKSAGYKGQFLGEIKLHGVERGPSGTRP